MAPSQSLPPHGKPLGRLDLADLNEVIKKVGSEKLLYGSPKQTCFGFFLPRFPEITS